MITFQLESWIEYFPDCQDLWKEDNEELSDMQLNPDIARYELMDKEGFLQILTVRDKGKLVGYHIDIIQSSIHSKHILCSYEDASYLNKSYRRGITGIRMISEVVRHLKSKGVIKSHMISPAIRDTGKIFSYLGFSKCDTIYSKWI